MNGRQPVAGSPGMDDTQPLDLSKARSRSHQPTRAWHERARHEDRLDERTRARGGRAAMERTPGGRESADRSGGSPQGARDRPSDDHTRQLPERIEPDADRTTEMRAASGRSAADRAADRSAAADRAEARRRPAGGTRPVEPAASKKTRSRRRGPVLVLLILVAIAGGGGYFMYRTLFAVPDYVGSGEGDVIIQIREGDPTTAIAAELVREGVVKSAKAFTQAAAEDDARARSLQPGFYQMRLQMSGSSAISKLLDPKSRVGQLEIKGGVQLDDTRLPDGTVAPGVLTLISRATCAQLNGASTCISAEQLRTAMSNTAPAQLGVPAWAAAETAKAEPRRKLEGLLAPGRYNVRPGSSAVEVLRDVVTKSAAQYEALGITSVAQQSKYSAYQLLVVASLVEKEGITADFGKISRVIYNRLKDRIRLGMDSTVNYPLDLQEVRTNAEDRGRPGPYNSYLNYGLPPTPIGAPGQRAIQAALDPEEGPWLYFVRCERDGTSCFSTSLPEHEKTVREAVAAGAF